MHFGFLLTNTTSTFSNRGMDENTERLFNGDVTKGLTIQDFEINRLIYPGRIETIDVVVIEGRDCRMW